MHYVPHIINDQEGYRTRSTFNNNCCFIKRQVQVKPNIIIHHRYRKYEGFNKWWWTKIVNYYIVNKPAFRRSFKTRTFCDCSSVPYQNVPPKRMLTENRNKAIKFIKIEYLHTKIARTKHSIEVDVSFYFIWRNTS
jgi:hypothetical protein